MFVGSVRTALCLALIAVFAILADAREPVTSGTLIYRTNLAIYGFTGPSRTPSFTAEPKYESKNLIRGSLPIDVNPPIGFVLDKDNQKLYLDLNRNGDLTDDPNGVFPNGVKNTMMTYVFNELSLTLDHGSLVTYSVSITIDQTGGATCYVKSGWTGEVELNAQKWRFTFIENMDGRFSSDDMLRITHADEPPDPIHSALNNNLLTKHIFINDTLYELELNGSGSGEQVKVSVKLRPRTCDLGTVHIGKALVHRLCLDEKIYSTMERTRVVVYDPPADFKVPRGEWKVSEVELKDGSVRDASNVQFLTVSAGQAAQMPIAPLQGKIQLVDQRASRATFTYSLMDASGNKYTQPYPTRPRIEISKGGRAILNTAFEFG